MSQSAEGGKWCPECGADNLHFADRCWMCGGDLKNVAIIAAEVAGPATKTAALPIAKPAWARSESRGLMLVAALAGLLLLVGIGIYASEPVLVVPFAVVATPALLATFIRASRKQVQNKPMGSLETAGTFLISFAISGVVAAGVVIVLAAVAIISLIALCFSELAKH